MNLMRTRGFGMGVFAFVAAMCVLLVAAEPAAAQGMREGGGRPGRGRRPIRKHRPTQKNESWKKAGMHRCRIFDFDLVDGEEAEDYVGILKVLPLEEDARMVKVRIPRSEDFHIELGTYKFVPEQFFEDIPWKGLIGSMSWGYPEDRKNIGDGDGQDDPRGSRTPRKAKKKQRFELKSLSFEKVEVVGKIEEIDGDLIVLKVVPKDEQPWPNRVKPSKKRPNKSDASKRVVRKKLKLRILDEVTQFVDGGFQMMDMGDFDVGQDIEAILVLSTTTKGIMVVLQAPDVVLAPKTKEKGDKPWLRRPRGARPGGKRGPRI